MARRPTRTTDRRAVEHPPVSPDEAIETEQIAIPTSIIEGAAAEVHAVQQQIGLDEAAGDDQSAQLSADVAEATVAPTLPGDDEPSRLIEMGYDEEGPQIAIPDVVEHVEDIEDTVDREMDPDGDPRAEAMEGIGDVETELRSRTARAFQAWTSGTSVAGAGRERTGRISPGSTA